MPFLQFCIIRQISKKKTPVSSIFRKIPCLIRYCSKIMLALTNAASANVFSPSPGFKYPYRSGSTSGKTPMELTGQAVPISADMSAEISACSTSRLYTCFKFHGVEYSSWDEGVVSGRGPRMPFPHAMSGVRVQSGSR